MNLDLAMMALDGLSRSPVAVHTENGSVVIAGNPACLKEVARLLLLLGGDTAEPGASFRLEPGIHATKDSATIELRLG